MNDDPPSPCIKVCSVNNQGICTGCGRSLDEIAAWPDATPQLRQWIVERARQRKIAAPRLPDKPLPT